jgi:hypothetical protein
VVARMTELDTGLNHSGSNHKTKAQSVKGTLQFLHIVEKLKVKKSYLQSASLKQTLSSSEYFASYVI